jgi:16S rRNA processing protein RimM
MNSQPSDLVELGVLRGSYGLLGWSHVQPHAGNGETLRRVRQWWLLPPSEPDPVHASASDRLERSAELLEVAGVRVHGSALVAKWQGCDTPEAAQSLKGWRVAVARAQFPALPEGEYYWVDLVGLSVINRQEQAIGTVSAVRSNGAHDFLEVTPVGGGPAVLIPQVPAYVDHIDLPAACVRVDWGTDW